MWGPPPTVGTAAPGNRLSPAADLMKPFSLWGVLFPWRSALGVSLCSAPSRPSRPSELPRSPCHDPTMCSPFPQYTEKQLRVLPAAPVSHFSRQLPSMFSDGCWGSGSKPLGLESMRPRLSEPELGVGFPCFTSVSEQKWKREELTEPRERVSGEQGSVRGGVWDLYSSPCISCFSKLQES